MATADIETYPPEEDWGHTLFSKQYCGQLLIKIVRVDSVVEKFIDSKTISEDERKSLGYKKVADQKLRLLLSIITDNCNGNDLQAFKVFIDILRDTKCKNNVDIAQQLSLIYNERVYYVAALSRLSKEKSLVRNLENEKSYLQSILKEKERYIESLTDEKNKLAELYRKAADDQNETLREDKLSLEKQIKKKEEDILFVEKEMGELTRTKNDLENEVNLKTNAIRERDKDIVKKEREVSKAIAESNRLRLKIDELQEQQSKAMAEDREEMSMKIDKLEDELEEKENSIVNLRKNKTMTLGEIEEELGNITKDQGIKLDDQAKNIDSLAKGQMQLNEKINFLTEALMRLLSLQEKK